MSTDTYRRGSEKVVVTFDDDTNAFLHGELYRNERQVASTTDKQAAEDWMARCQNG